MLTNAVIKKIYESKENHKHSTLILLLISLNKIKGFGIKNSKELPIF